MTVWTLQFEKYSKLLFQIVIRNFYQNYDQLYMLFWKLNYYIRFHIIFKSTEHLIKLLKLFCDIMSIIWWWWWWFHCLCSCRRGRPIEAHAMGIYTGGKNLVRWQNSCGLDNGGSCATPFHMLFVICVPVVEAGTASFTVIRSMSRPRVFRNLRGGVAAVNCALLACLALIVSVIQWGLWLLPPAQSQPGFEESLALVSLLLYRPKPCPKLFPAPIVCFPPERANDWTDRTAWPAVDLLGLKLNILAIYVYCL